MNIHERRFAGTAGAHDRHELALVDAKVNAAQRMDDVLAHDIFFFKAF